MKRILPLLFMCMVSIGVRGQDGVKAPKATPQRSPAIVALLNNARFASPEIAADTFIKIVESKKVTESVWRREILDEALRITDDVKNPVRRTGIPFKGVPVDTQAGYLSYAFDLKLDQLSLKGRIIKQLLIVDKERARQIVYQMGGRLGLKPLSCEDTLAYEVSDIYRTVGEVAKSVFSQKEIVDGVRALYIAPWFENIDSPSQIGPALDLLGEMHDSPMERHMLFQALATGINRNFSDDRSFTYAIARGGLTEKIGRAYSHQDDPLNIDMRMAFRSFLLKNLRGARCLDNEIKKDIQFPPYLEVVNSVFFDKPFSYDDVVSVDAKGNPKILNYWRSNIAKQLSREYAILRSQQKIDPAAKDDGSDADWNIKVNTFVENLQSWSASDTETESDVFNQKCVLFRTLIGVIPDANLKKSVTRGYLRYLANSPLQKENFIEWFLHVRWQVTTNREAFVELAQDYPNMQFRVLVEASKLGL